MNLNEPWRPYKSKSGHISRSQIEQIENESNTYSWKRNLSVPRRQNQHKNHSIFMEPSTSEYYVLVSNPTAETTLLSMDPPRHSNFMLEDYPFYPNYMARTESSRAKVRSQSEPKQRPSSSARMKNKQIETVDGMSLPMNDQIQTSLQNLKHNGNSPWFMKLYQLTKTSKDRDGGSTRRKFSRPDELL